MSLKENSVKVVFQYYVSKLYLKYKNSKFTLKNWKYILNKKV